MAIRTTIKLDGIETIISQLKTFGKAGEDAARQLQAALENINTKKLEQDLQSIKSNSDNIVTSILNFRTILAGTAFGVVAKAAIDFASAGIESAVALERNAAAAGLTTEKYQVLSEAMRAAGGSQEQLNNALRRFTMQVDTQGQEQLKTFTDITKEFIQATGGIGGIAFKTVADFDKIREAAARAAPVLRDFILKALPEPLRQIDALFPVEAIAAKLQQLLQVNEKFRQEFFKAGFDVPAQSISESLDKILEKSKGTLNTLGISLIGLGGQLKTPEKAFLEFIDVVSKMKTPAEQSAAIIKVFGRTAGPELAKLIREGTASLEEWQTFLQSKGILFSPEQLQQAQEADRAINRLSASFRSFRDITSINFAPVFADFLESLTKSIDDFAKRMEANKDEVNDWWNTIKEIASSENPFATFWDKSFSAFQKSFRDHIEGTKQELTALQRVPQIMAEQPQLSAFQALKQALAELRTKDQQTAQGLSTDWNSFGDQFARTSQSVVNAGNDMLRNWQQLQKASESAVKFVTPPAPGISPFAPAAPVSPAITPEQQATQLQNLLNPFQQADDEIRSIWIDLMDFISTALNDVNLSGMTDKLVQPFRDAVPGIIQVIDQVKQLIYELMLQIALAQAGIQNLGAFATGGQQGPRTFGFAASGGYIRGPGTTTSDSILAWLSDKEFVINAKAVSHYGADFFAALNSMRLPKDVFGQFNMGGLIDRLARSMPKLATGGMMPAMASSGTSVTFIIDRQSFDLTASDNTIARLRRYAVASQLSSAGRKPSWVK